ncbi:MAG TPA: LCCL domain-containing protein [Rhodothermales bacterium]|nr:LCCL domain-containing protein [Rhodothermales bacterium]
MTLRLLSLAALVAVAALPASGCMQARQMVDQAMQASQTVQADWSADASQYRGQNGTRVAFICPPGGSRGSLWGTTLYSDDSSVCTAGVHAGRISFGQGGRVVVEIRAGASSYQASTRNGVESSSYGAWSGSYVVL